MTLSVLEGRFLIASLFMCDLIFRILYIWHCLSCCRNWWGFSYLAQTL